MKAAPFPSNDEAFNAAKLRLIAFPSVSSGRSKLPLGSTRLAGLDLAYRYLWIERGSESDPSYVSNVQNLPCLWS
jgi:hypothetical protein